MLLIRALQNRRVRSLWLGQVFSAMGDEVYRVAFVWLSVQMIGSNTGYLSSLQLLTAILFGLLGGRLVDALPSEQAMMRLDFLRFALVLVPVIFYFLGIASFEVLAVSAIGISGLGALFEPALMQTIPKVAQDPKLLRGANGLMGLTFRLARVLGPAVIGLLSPMIPMIHFFTLDAFTYLGSAYSIHSIKIKPVYPPATPPLSFRAILYQFRDAWREVQSVPSVFHTLITKSIAGGAWGLAYGVGLALLAQEKTPGDVSTYGLMMSAYGIGNVVGALWFGNRERQQSESMVYQGLVWLGIMFMGIALAPSVTWILLFVALSALGGPWNDLPFVDLVQQKFPNESIGKVFRVRNITETTIQLGMMLASPLLFQKVGLLWTLILCSIMMLGPGLWGIYKIRISR